jgi:AcrR family transcriptional regulator
MSRKGRGARTYRTPVRDAAAAQTRRAILEAAQSLFEQRGWAGTTIAAVARAAHVSPKTLEAVFGTKAALLRATVDFAIRGDEQPSPLAARAAVARMESAATAAELLDLHAAHVRRVAARSAGVAWAVEQAAPFDPSAAELWHAMTRNRRHGTRWAARTLLAKPDAAPTLRRADVETAFWLALDWSTYRSLTLGRGLGPIGFQHWLRRYYRHMLEA